MMSGFNKMMIRQNSGIIYFAFLLWSKPSTTKTLIAEVVVATVNMDKTPNGMRCIIYTGM
jgi:hypothetical protein